MNTQKNWVDYKGIKSAVTMEMVLQHYGVLETLTTVAGKNVLGCCPIHKGSNSRQFSVYMEKSIWRCFGACDTGGNVLDFVKMMEGVSLRDAALLLQKRFLQNEEENSRERETQTPIVEEIKNDHEKVIDNHEEKKKAKEVNPPLKFTLKSLEKDHAFLQEMGLHEETIDHFGLGFCTKGLMKGRVVIPIHDHQGNLIAYCGRSVTEEQIETDGKYKMPQNFVRSEVVYNLHRQKSDTDTLVLVEDFFTVIKAYQSGFENFIAIMGANLAKSQEEAILSHLGGDGKLLLIFSSGEYSRKCCDSCLERFSSKIFVKKIDISPFNKTACQLSAEELKSLF